VVGLARFAALTFALTALCAAHAVANSPPSLGGDEILARARATFHAHARPPFVAYTVARREMVNQVPDFFDTYELRVWYRSADGSALARRVERGVAFGPLHYIRPRFNDAVDPGPPTADIFEPAPAPAAKHGAVSADRETMPTIANVQVKGEFDYRAATVEIAGGSYHLKLQALRDPERNRLREVWVDAATFEVRRIVADDRLFMLPSDVSYPDRLDATLAADDGVPLIEHVAMTTVPDWRSHAPDEQSDYRFKDVAFPAALPDWYFDPRSYRAHIGEAPTH